MGAMVVSVVLAFGAGTAIAAVSVVGEFDGTLGGYGDSAGEDLKPNEITVDGQFTVEEEPAQQVEVIIEPAQWTVLDTGSASVFVEGDASVEFEQRVSSETIRLTTEEIPADTTVRVSFSTFYTGGTDADEIEAGTVTVRYVSAGGSEGENTFVANTSMSNSPESELTEAKNDGDGENSLLIPGVAGGVILLLLVVGYFVLRDDKPY